MRFTLSCFKLNKFVNQSYYNKAFTIVELIVVVVVIGILASITLVSYGSITQRAITVTLQTDLTNASKRLEMEKTDYGYYPTSEVSVNSGLGLEKSTNTDYNQYFSNGKNYCLSATSLSVTSISYHITSDNNIPAIGPCTNTWKIISAGESHTCAISFDDKAYCWGDNASGMLGDGTAVKSNLPVSVLYGAMPTGPIKSIAVGGYHTCAIASDDRAYCWGLNDSDGELGDGTSNSSWLPVRVSQGAMADVRVKQIKAGRYHTCVLSFDDKVYCWGYNPSGELGNGANSSSLVPSAISQGSMPSVNVKTIAVGDGYTCVINFDDKVYCWGQNDQGQLGMGNTTNSNLPISLLQGALPDPRVRSISSIGAHSCAIAISNNQAYCWGANWSGQLGNGTKNNSNIPVGVLLGDMPNIEIKMISVGYSHSCAVAINDKAYCWGDNFMGQLGDGKSSGDVSVPKPVDTTGLLAGKVIVGVYLGYDYSCLLDLDNYAYCWGTNVGGQLGDNKSSASNSNIPVAVGIAYSTVDPSVGNIGFTAKLIASGPWHGCAVTFDDRVYCWGGNWSGQLGDGTNNASTLPVPVDMSGVLAGKSIKSISAGYQNTCVLTTEDKAYCWGDGTQGQLGNNSMSNSYVPIATALSGSLSGKTILEISVGNWHVCAISSDHKAHCWGGGAEGKLGNNSTGNSSVPVAVNTAGVLNNKTIKSLQAGRWFNCVIASDDAVYCWGTNTYGQLGNNSTVNSSVPVEVDKTGVLNEKTISGLYTGGDGICVTDNTGKSYCWGKGVDGELGNGANLNSSSPVAVNTGGVLYQKMDGGRDSMCSITTLGELYCMGLNYTGQLGEGGLIQSSNLPVRVLSGSIPSGAVKDISSGFLNTCVIASDDKVYCWGGNYGGELGDGMNSGTSSYVPVRVFSTN